MKESIVKSVRSKQMVGFLRLKRRILSHVWAVRIVGILAILGLTFLILYGAISLAPPRVLRYANLISTFLFTPRDKIESVGGRTNILLLGKGGAGHEAPDLTDTMIFASISDSGGVTLVSLPRDIWISELRAKLNSVYYWGNQKAQDGGLVLSKAIVESIVGKPVHYVLVIDFSGIARLVDAVGGIEVDVENSFTDEKFPVVGRESDDCGGDTNLTCRYEALSFEKGVQHMDGATALKFIRSRYADSPEGTDLARSLRQQKVIAAIEKKILSKEVLLSSSKIKALIELFETSVAGDLDETAAAVLARKLFDSRNNRQSYVLGADFLENPPISSKYDNLYVFIPKGGSWDNVHHWIEDILGLSSS